MSLSSAILLMKRIRDEELSYDDLSIEEKVIADCLIQSGFVYVTGDRRLKLTVYGAEIVSLNEDLERLEQREDLEDICKDLVAEIKYHVEMGDYSAAMFYLFELYHALDAIMYKQGRLIL